jgi:hypothetical protein
MCHDPQDKNFATVEVNSRYEPVLASLTFPLLSPNSEVGPDCFVAEAPRNDKLRPFIVIASDSEAIPL